MIAVKYQSQVSQPTDIEKFQIGDRVRTSNCCLGTIVRKAQDELGEYLVVKLDSISDEFAYDVSDLEKL